MLFIAAQHNREAMVKDLLKSSGGEQSPNAKGVTPLMIALKEGNDKIAKVLLDNKCCKQVEQLLEERDNDERNVFHYALGSRKPVEAIKILVDVCSDTYKEDYSKEMEDFLTTKDLNEDTPFHILVQQPLEKSEFDAILRNLSNGKKPPVESQISRERELFDLSRDEIEDSYTEEDLHSHDNRTRMRISQILECMKVKNETKETPLHKAARNGQTSFVEALFDLSDDKDIEATLENLLIEKDENANTPLHLATQKTEKNQLKTQEVAKILLTFIRNHTKDAFKYLTKKNSFGWTPFSGVVAGGDLEMVEDMLRRLTEVEKRAIINQPDFSNTFPLHLAAKYGHVDIFNVLLENKAEVTQRGRNQKTALDIAIENDKRSIIQTIITGDSWKEAFQIPSTSVRGDLDTPLRQLIREMPDIAEEFMDRCCEEVPSDERGSPVIKMDASFIEDTHKYSIVKKGTKIVNEFRFIDGTHRAEEEEKEYQVDINNHPMVIMADEKKLDLLQHPLCIAIILKKWSLYRWYYYFQLAFYLIFLTFLSIYAMTSPSPITYPQLFQCTAFFRQPSTIAAIGTNSTLNNACRWILLVIILLRVALFFAVQEYEPILNKLKTLGQGEKLQSSIKSIPFVFLFDFIVYLLALYIAIHNFSNVTTDGEHFIGTDVRECGQWQISALTVTLAWLNLLVYMRMLYVVGKYIILLQDVLLTFMAVFVVVFVVVMAFASAFYMLLSNRDNFEMFPDSLLKTMIMMSGEYDYGDIFFKDLPPSGWGDDWDIGHETVPFPFLTYALFVAFFFLVSIVALNVLVGLTVDDIRNFLQNADLLKLKFRLRYILAQERGHLMQMVEQRKVGKDKESNIIQIKKQHEMAKTNDLISKAKIWEKVEKKREERRLRTEHQQEQLDQKKLIHDQTRKIKEMLSKRRRIQERPEGKVTNTSHRIRRPSFSSVHERPTKTTSFESDDDDISELTHSVAEMLKYMRDYPKPQEANLEIERLKAENKYLKDMQQQKDVQISRLQANLRERKGVQDQKGIERLEEDSREIKNHLKSLLRHLSLEKANDGSFC